MRRACLVPVFGFLLLLPFDLGAQWQTKTELPGVDMSALKPAQREKALRMLRDMDCTCGCGMKVAQCRVEDPNCSYSKSLSAMVLKGFEEGKTRDEIAKTIAASKVGKQREPAKLLEDPVRLSVKGDPSQGPMDARILIVEFSDFECPYCAKAAAEVADILKAYPKDVRLVYKQFPLSTHPHAAMAAAASLAAQEQGKFWEMHDKLFENYRHLNRERVLDLARDLKLDIAKFTATLDAAGSKTRVDSEEQEGEVAGVTGTPAFFINGKLYNGPVNLASLKPILNKELVSGVKSAKAAR